MGWSFGSASRIGARSEQQDRLAVLTDAGRSRILAVVADGLGGHAGGARAAEAIVGAAESAWRSQYGSDSVAMLEELAAEAQRRVAALGPASREIAQADLPRSTCVALAAGGAQAAWIHVGDSRLYCFSRRQLIRRTRDHSLAQALVDMGRLAAAEASMHPDRHRLLDSFGGSQMPGIERDQLQLAAEASFALCSDGLWEHVPDDELAAALTRPDLAAAASDLADRACERGGASGDNVSLILLRWISDSA